MAGVPGGTRAHDPELDALLAGVALRPRPFAGLVASAGLDPDALRGLGSAALSPGGAGGNLGLLEALGLPGGGGRGARGLSPGWALVSRLAAGAWGSPTSVPPQALLDAASRESPGPVEEALGSPGLGALLRAVLGGRAPLFALDDLLAVPPRCEHRLAGAWPGALPCGVQALLWRLFPGLPAAPEDGLALADVVARVQGACVAEWERRCAALSALFHRHAGPHGVLAPDSVRAVAEVLAGEGVALRGWDGGPLSFTGLCGAALAFRHVL